MARQKSGLEIRFTRHRISVAAMIAFMLLASLHFAPQVHAQAPEATPQEQCKQGVQRLLDQKPTEAGPLLEAGFAARDSVEFAKPEDLGLCGWALGYVRLFAGDKEGALKAFEIALVAFRKGSDQAYTISALYAVGQANYQLRRLAEAETAYQESIVLAQRLGNPSFGLAALGGLMVLYDDQGHFNEVISVHQQRLPLLTKPDELAVSFNTVGKAYLALGRLTEASDALQEALGIFRELKDRQGEAATLNRMGEVASTQGQSSEAMRLFEQSAALYRDGGDVFGALNAETNIATEFRIQGRYGVALERYKAALTELEAMPTEPVTASFVLDTRGQFLNNLGVVYLEQANPVSAEPYLTEALSITKQLGLRHAEAVRLINRGQLYEQQAAAAVGERDRARFYEQALVDYTAALAIGDDLGLLDTQYRALNAIGVVRFKQERLDEVFAAQSRALQIARQQGVPSAIAGVLINLGTVFHDRQQYVEALEHFTEALTLAKASGLRQIEVEALARIARTLQLRGDSTEALARYEETLALLGQLRAVAGNEEARAGFVGKYADVYERAARLYLEQGDTEAAFDTVERGRARSFLDSLAVRAVEFADTSLNAEAERLREADATLEAARRELAVVRQTSPTSPTLITRLEARVTETEQNYRTAYKAIAQRGDQTAAIAPDGAVRSLAEIQQLLPANTTILAFHVGDETTLAFAVTRERVSAKELPAGKDAIATFVRTVVEFDGDGSASARSAAELYTTLIAPMRDQFMTPRLIVVPHGVLHYLPFAALQNNERRYLGDDFAVTLLPAASLLAFTQRADPPGATLSPVLVMANPDARIPGVVAAAEAIGMIMAQPPLLNEQATKEALRERGPTARVIHLGTHGTFAVTNTLESNLQLYSGEAGRLTTGEVYGLSLPDAALVTLSACETQVNQLVGPTSPLVVTPGDELVGMQRAFFFAGAQNVVTTLWQVPDQPSRLLMERFYTHIRDGLAPANALQQAQQEVRVQYPNPRDWAGFVLSGVGATPLVEPLPWWQKVPWWGGALGGVGLLTAVGSGALLWRRRAMLSPGVQLAKD